MVYDVNELRNHIDDYFSGTLSKTELGEWAEKAYYDLLKGSYVEIKKIALYPFLKSLSSIHVPINDIDDTYPCTKEDVLEIQSILHGEKDLDFQIEMAIPPQVYTMFPDKIYFDGEKKEILCELRRDTFDYIQNKISDINVFSKYIHLFTATNKQTETVLDILENYIERLCMILFNTDSIALKRGNSLKLYPLKMDYNSLIEKLIDYLDCYIGTRNFNILVSYRNGLPDTILIV